MATLVYRTRMSTTEHLLPLILPPTVWGNHPVQLLRWLVVPGEIVATGDILLEAGLPGIVGDLRAPTDGTIQERVAADNTWITPGEIVGWLAPSSPAATQDLQA